MNHRKDISILFIYQSFMNLLNENRTSEYLHKRRAIPKRRHVSFLSATKTLTGKELGLGLARSSAYWLLTTSSVDLRSWVIL